MAHFGDRLRPRESEVVAFLKRDTGFRRINARHPGHLHIAHWITAAAPMQPMPAVATWALPALVTVDDLAAHLRLSPAELAWFADLKSLTRKPRVSAQLQHYHYRWLTKSTGALRLIESPKGLLKKFQRHILTTILNCVPPHPAVHGFVACRSIKTFASPHTAQAIVLRLDLQDFFPSIRRARVQSIFRTLGYPETVADLLGGLCTNAAPSAIFQDQPSSRDLRDLYAQTHLPQGAPTSPALANIAAYRMDCRLFGLAQASGITYTRYADDLAFSGSVTFARSADRFATHVASIAMQEGFAINHRKTRIMRSGSRQHLAGLVVNQHPNIARPDFDRLKATLHNCLRNGPTAENRENIPHFRSHLLGRIAFVAMANPTRGARLARLFEAIAWSEDRTENHLAEGLPNDRA